MDDGMGNWLKEKSGRDEEVVRVGDVEVRLNGEEDNGVRKVRSKGGESVTVGDVKTQVTDKYKLISKYKPVEIDIA